MYRVRQPTASVHAGMLAAVMAALALAACGTVGAGSGVPDPDRVVDADTRTPEQVQRLRFEAMVAQNVAALEPLLAQDLTYTHSTGELENKAQFLETIRTGRLRYQAIDVHEFDVRRYDRVALVTGRASVRARAGDRALQLDLRFNEVSVMRDGRWQLVAWHSTRVQPP